jgi:hypothetical protein
MHRFARFLPAFVAVLMLLVCSDAAAVMAPGLHEGIVPVADKSDSSRADAMRAALAQVLIKLTGDSAVAKQAGAADILRETQRYVLEYRYQSAAQPAAGTPPLSLWVRFDATAVDQAVAAAGLPLWGRERPATLVWLVVEDGGNATIVNADDTHGYVQVLQAQALRRGLPLVLPLLDLTDQTHISADDIRRNDADRIRSASARYAADATLSAVVSQTSPGLWQGSFTLYLAGQNSTWVAKGGAFDAVVAEGVDDVADALALRYAHADASGSAGSVQLVVDGIGNASQYADVLQFLGRLNTVTDVSVVRVEPDRVTFSLDSRGGMQAISESIALSGMLQPEGNGADGHYRLRP